MKKFIFVVWLFLAVLGSFNLVNFTHAQETKTVSPLDAIKRDDDDCMKWLWQWCLNIDKLLFPNNPIDAKNKNRTLLTVSKDVVFAATRMVWTVLTIVIIYCGLMYIFAARWGKDVNAYKKWLISAAVWAILVRWAYAIVRLVQYIAKW